MGLHPVVSLFALLAGADLFGVWGAILASPIAGVVQALLIAFWQNWRENHPEQFPAQGAVSSIENATKEVGKRVAPIGEALSSMESTPPSMRK